jgi:hypothetical protein
MGIPLSIYLVDLKKGLDRLKTRLNSAFAKKNRNLPEKRKQAQAMSPSSFLRQRAQEKRSSRRGLLY